MSDFIATKSLPNSAYEDIVFALDVGTGTIAGIVGMRENGFFRVLAAETYEYENRVMFDGQIHDIGAVAQAVSLVRDRLSKNVGFPLDAAYIAAAGRALKTVRAGASGDIQPEREIDEALLESIENEALRQAREAVAGDCAQKAFEYVGCAVTGGYLDGYPISNLLGHKGLEVRIELIATFLPCSVVESLFAVMRKADIVIAGLMLEPNAALNAIVSKNNRRLNLALVDIGAGTSDIAITRDGSVFSYNMVPFAGDKITERICERFLTDFKAGEKIKYALYENVEEIKISDIFDRECAVSYDEVYGAVLPVIKEMAAKIAGVIISDNHEKPAAVIVVGGGCRLPGMEIHLAEALGINIDRVAIQDRKAIIGLKCDFDTLSGPESVTPFGIALSGAGGDCIYKNYMAVRLNKRPVRLPDANEYNISDILDAMADMHVKLEAKPGKALSFYINGEFRTIFGGEERPPSFSVNGAVATPGTVVKAGDDIVATGAEDGADARVFVGDLAPKIDVGTVTCGNVEYYIAPRASINGEVCALSAEVREGDHVELSTQTTVKMFVDDYLGDGTGASYIVNGEAAGGDYVLSPGDEIVVLREENTSGDEGISGEASSGIETGAEETNGIKTNGIEIAGIETVEKETNDTETAGIETGNIETGEIETGVIETIVDETNDIETNDIETACMETVEIETYDTETSDIETTGEDTRGEDTRDEDEYAVNMNDVDTRGEDESAADEFGDSDSSNTYTVFINGEMVGMSSTIPEPMLVDAFNHVVLERKNGQGRLLLQVNGRPAKLTDPIKTGDSIYIDLVSDDFAR